MSSLRVGMRVPDIDATTHRGQRFKLSAVSARIHVVYFFTKAFTPGCVKETSIHRDNYPELLRLGVSVVGVSTDDATTQCRFADSLVAPFPMVPDADRKISRAWDVVYPIVRLVHRQAFIVDRKLVLLATFQNQHRVVHHTNAVMEFVRWWCQNHT